MLQELQGLTIGRERSLRVARGHQSSDEPA